MINACCFTDAAIEALCNGFLINALSQPCMTVGYAESGTNTLTIGNISEEPQRPWHRSLPNHAGTYIRTRSCPNLIQVLIELSVSICDMNMFSSNPAMAC